MITSDFHTHTTFSTDGTSDMESMIKEAIRLGLKQICFTEHNDYGARFDEGPGAFVVDTEAYRKKYLELAEKYKDRITVLFGVEIGLLNDPAIAEHFRKYTKAFPFDFIIGSAHFACGLDPYKPSYWESFESPEAAVRSYFEEELACLSLYDCFHSFGHLDYALRYAPQSTRDIGYEPFYDILGEVLTALIAGNKVLEINSGGFRSPLHRPNPAVPIIRCYRELGGLPPTIGSDAHITSDLARDFHRVEEILSACGFHSYSVFEKGIRSEVSLDPSAAPSS
ncbi:MAG: histidinol-phosphatase HisJ family protein [Lachnospiraceae bacterium]|nr:histidinol-phosphatase HisJ family protein [Lachnospiraceae bacterium]